MQNQSTFSGAPELISYKALRLFIGVLGILLPIALLVFSRVNGCTTVLDSISHYYYSRVGDLFVGIIFTFATFLIAYRGYTKEDKLDAIVTTIGGLAAMCLVLVPTSNIDAARHGSCCELFQLNEANGRRDFQIAFHFGSAAVFLLSMSFMSFFQFPRSFKEKRKSNTMSAKDKWLFWTYKLCGVLVLLAIISAGLASKYEWHFGGVHAVLVFEWVALYAFAIPWILKSKIGFLQD